MAADGLCRILVSEAFESEIFVFFSFISVSLRFFGLAFGLHRTIERFPSVAEIVDDRKFEGNASHRRQSEANKFHYLTSTRLDETRMYA